MQVPFVITEHFVTTHVNGKSLVATSDHPNFPTICAALQAGNIDSIAELFSIPKSMKIPTVVDPTQPGAVHFDKNTGRLLYRGYEIHGTICDRVVTLHKQGRSEPCNFLISFIENLYLNPSSSVVSRLYAFLEKGKLPITNRGTFLAYKKIRRDWTDAYTGTIDNSIGATPTMPRSLVNDNDSVTCSTGLHFCSFDYLGQFPVADYRVVVVEINPKDVVSIPTDYNNTKGRCCAYTVIEEVTAAVDVGPVFTEHHPVVEVSAARGKSSKTAVTKIVVPVDDVTEISLQLRACSNTKLVTIFNTLVAKYKKHQIVARKLTPVQGKFRTIADGVSRITKSFSLPIIRELIANTR